MIDEKVKETIIPCVFEETFKYSHSQSFVEVPGSLFKFTFIYNNVISNISRMNVILSFVSDSFMY